MAIRRDVFNQIGLAKIWSKALSDDYALTYAVKKTQIQTALRALLFGGLLPDHHMEGCVGVL